MPATTAIDFTRLALRKDLPAHRQIAAYLKTIIALGQALAGDLLPAPSALAAQLRSSPAEVKKAYAELVGRGFLEVEGSKWRISDGHSAVGSAREAEELCGRLWELVADARRAGFSKAELQRIFEQLLARA